MKLKLRLKLKIKKSLISTQEVITSTTQGGWRGKYLSFSPFFWLFLLGLWWGFHTRSVTSIFPPLLTGTGTSALYPQHIQHTNIQLSQVPSHHFPGVKVLTSSVPRFSIHVVFPWTSTSTSPAHLSTIHCPSPSPSTFTTLVSYISVHSLFMYSLHSLTVTEY